MLPLTVRAWKREVRPTSIWYTCSVPSGAVYRWKYDHYIPWWQRLRCCGTCQRRESGPACLVGRDSGTDGASPSNLTAVGRVFLGALETDAHPPAYPGYPGQRQSARGAFRPTEAVDPQSPRLPGWWPGHATSPMPLPSYRPDGFGAQSRAAMAVPDWQSGTSMRTTAPLPSRIGNSTTARQGTLTRISMRTSQRYPSRSSKAACEVVWRRPSAIPPVLRQKHD